MPEFPAPAEIVRFWREAGHARWFGGGPEFDREIRDRFEAVHLAAARRELDGWAESAEGALALLLVLDQFPRHIYRGSAHAFATDPLARRAARAACDAGFDQATEPALRPFFYLPFEHSEDLADQEHGLRLAEAWGDAETLKWMRIHHEIIARFGRFPHRNPALARDTLPEEQAFLDAGGFAG